MENRKIYLIDFDGTITKEDTLTEIAKYFFKNEYVEWGNKLMKGEYTIKEWLNSFEERFDISQKMYDKFLLEIGIDETFKEFIDKKTLKVVSGGFDYNIKKIFENEKIDNIEIYANNFKFISNDKIRVEMNYFNEKCGKCGVCKKIIVEKYKKTYKEVVFIGDGITDICGARASDKVYVKKGSYLEEKMKEEGIKTKSFNKFEEVD